MCDMLIKIKGTTSLLPTYCMAGNIWVMHTTHITCIHTVFIHNNMFKIMFMVATTACPPDMSCHVSYLQYMAIM